MNRMLKFIGLFLLILFSYEKLISQIDSIAFEDSLSTDNKLENLVEQNNETEDSPLLDYIENRNVNKLSYFQIRSRIIQRLQQPSGYEDGRYSGSRLKSYQRIKFSRWNHYSGGILIEKDAGEVRFNDFVTGNLTISDYGPLSKLVLGDYFIEAGQGIALWRSYDVSKGAEVITPVKRKPSGLNPYLSSGESNYFRGAATEWNIGRFSPVIFYSNQSRSASLDSNGRVRSFYDMGYFRTSNEMNKRNTVRENIYGVRCSYKLSQLNSIGFTYFQASYSRNIFLDEGREFSGDRYSVISFDYNFSLPTVSVFGELVRGNERIAGSSGLVIAPDDAVNIIISGRYYPLQLVSLHGLGFGEQASNEKGFYTGVRIKPLHNVTISSYYDQYQSIEQMPFPSAGNDLLTYIEFSPFKNLDIALRYRRKVSNVTESITNINGFISDVIERQYKHNIRLNFDYQVSPKISVRCRYEQLFLRSSGVRKGEKGFLTYQEVIFKPTSNFIMNTRIIVFRFDSYFSGVFEYERDLDGVLTQPILYGSGVRWYLLFKYELINRVKLSVKYSDYIRDDVKRIGTGLDQLPGNHDTRVAAQLDIGF
jgi:hypothetical protein